MQSNKLEEFINAALPYSHWGETYFDIRILEYRLTDGLFNDVLSSGGMSALDIGCGIGLAPVYLSQYFTQVDGIDIPDIGVAFNADKSPPVIGDDLISATGIQNVKIYCGNVVEFLKARPESYDFIFSHFVLEHVPELPPLMDALYSALKPGGKTLHIVPNTHDTINQLLIHNLSPLKQNVKSAWRARRETGRVSGRLQGSLFTPITHSEFIGDYIDQFEINSSEHYLFPMLRAGLKVRDIKPMREHAYGILAERPTAKPAP